MEGKKTPLFEEHLKLQAKIGPFGGWQMPISYGGIIQEHNWTRKSASVFDICHMGEFVISGPEAARALNKIVTMDVEKAPPKSCKYGFMLNEEGGIIDDFIVYKIEDSKFMMVVNAATAIKDLDNLKKRLPESVALEDISEKIAKIDLQGPLSGEAIEDVLGVDTGSLKYYTFSIYDFLGRKNIVSRTGYTGELGFEIYIEVDKAAELWNKLLADKRVRPAGLGARDTLRLEMSYPLYGHELDEQTTPLEAGLKMFVDFKKDFLGRDNLLRQQQSGLKKCLVCFAAAGRRAPRRGYKILKNGNEIGVVSSGSFSPSLACGIGMGFISPEHQEEQASVVLSGSDVKLKGRIIKKPFYKQGSLKK